MPVKLADQPLLPPVLLAPMAGITDLPFRRRVAGFGAGLVVSEMIASQEVVQAQPLARARAELGMAEAAENMRDNSLFYNETMQLGIEPTTSSPPQCMPIRFLLDGVHIHCDTKSQLITDFNLFNSNQVNPTGAINIFITQTGTFPGGSNPGGFTNYGANAMVNASLTWGAPSTIIHEFAHMYWVRHPWEEGPVPYDLSDTFNPSWSWDHDCNPNTPEIESQTCWDTNPRHDGKNACGNPIFCTDHAEGGLMGTVQVGDGPVMTHGHEPPKK